MSDRVGGPRVRLAKSALIDAEHRLLQALREDYPVGAKVMVFHPRGAFEGEVTGWNTFGTRVDVYNPASGKTTGWWFERVQNLEAQGEPK